MNNEDRVKKRKEIFLKYSLLLEKLFLFISY